MVKKTLLLPQEVETYYIIPTIRMHLAYELKRQGKTQVQIAQIFDVTPATISQYTSKKRGHKITLAKDVQKEIEKQAKSITDQMSYIKAMQHILDYIRKSNHICDIHKKVTKTPQGCSPHKAKCGMQYTQ